MKTPSLAALAIVLAAAPLLAGPVADLVPGLASNDIAEQDKAQTALNALCTAADHKAVAAELAAQLAPTLPAQAALPLLRQAGLIGDKACVPAVTALLRHADARVRDAARQALELLPGGDADKALLAGLAGTKDTSETIGFIQSLGQRRTRDAVKVIEPFLKNRDDVVRFAAARALANMADDPSIAALVAARASAEPKLRDELTPALFDSAQSALRQGHSDAAISLYTQLGQSAESDRIRAQALLGLLLAEPKKAGQRIEAALGKDDDAIRFAAITAVARLGDPALAKILAGHLAALPDEGKVQGLAALAAAGDRSVLPSILPLLQTATGAVARATVNALVPLADGTCVDALLKLGALPDWKKDVAALLADAPGPGMDERLLQALGRGEPEQRLLAMDALIARQAPGLQKSLLTLAGDADDKIATTALTGMKRLVKAEDFDALLALVRSAPSRPRAEAALSTLFAAAGQARDPAKEVARIGPALADASADTQRALLAAGAKFGASAPLPAAMQILGLMDGLLDKPDLRANAAHFAIELAPRLLAADPDAVARVLSRIQAADVPAELKAKAATATTLEDGWLLNGAIAGPYEGGNLFTSAYAPEKGDVKVTWSALSDADRKDGNNRIIDLAKRIPGDNRVAYLSFAFMWPSGGAAELQVGSDDGVVVWLNGERVHGNDATRPCKPGDDKVPVTLKAGLNRILVKVIQRGGQFEFAGRLVSPAPAAH